METTTNTRETTWTTRRRDSGRARHPVVIATPSALLPLAASIVAGRHGGIVRAGGAGDHLSSGDTALIASTLAELLALAALVTAGAAARPARKGARA